MQIMYFNNHSTKGVDEIIQEKKFCPVLNMQKQEDQHYIYNKFYVLHIHT